MKDQDRLLTITKAEFDLAIETEGKNAVWKYRCDLLDKIKVECGDHTYHVVRKVIDGAEGK